MVAQTACALSVPNFVIGSPTTLLVVALAVSVLWAGLAFYVVVRATRPCRECDRLDYLAGRLRGDILPSLHRDGDGW